MKRYAPLQAAKSNTAEPAMQRRLKPFSVQNADPLQRLADQSGQVSLLQRLQAGADSHVQRKGIPAQRAATEDEDMLQGKFKAAQLAVPEEEEPIQGRFDTAQAAGLEEEEPLQGKLKTAQLATPEEEEEPLQGRFETAQAAGLEEEEPLQGKFERITGSSEAVHRKVDPTTEVNGVPVNDDPALEHEADVMGAKAAQFVPEDEEPVQGKFGAVAQKAEAQPNQTGLPDNLKAGVENLSGMSMNSVRVHYNSSKPAQLNALAFAQGTDIHVGPGQEQHLPHEAWHVVQQGKTMKIPSTLQRRNFENLPLQFFAVPDDLKGVRDDVDSVVSDIKKYQDNTKLPGGDTWAYETRGAAKRKLDEWNAYKYAYDNTKVGEDLPTFGEDVVAEPDVGTLDVDGKWYNVVENKYVTGKRAQITENVKNAIGQIKCSSRSVKYKGNLTARIHLSDDTREDLRANGSRAGDTKMQRGWESYLVSCTDLVSSPHVLYLEVINLPNRAGGNTNYSVKK